MTERGRTILRSQIGALRRTVRQIRRPATWVVAALGGLCVAAALATAEPAVYQSFDGPDPLWQLLDPRPGVQILAHGCVTTDAREGTGSERIAVVAPPGESVHLCCPASRVPVLDELEARMWVKSNRPGVTLGARVVMSRTLDPATHRPKTVLIEGTQYDQIGRWQQLSLSGVPKLLAARVRVLRTAPGVAVDPHEAFLDAITLVVPGGPDVATVWTDELAVDGTVVSAGDDDTPANAVATTDSAGRRATVQDSAVSPAAFATSGSPPSSSLVQVQDTTLFVAGKPFLPRGIEWNGEPLAFLAERGFNVAVTDTPPTADQTTEAQRADMWLICRPPRPDVLASAGLGRSLDRVLAWTLDAPDEHELDYYRGWAELVRQKDPSSHRPILIAPQSDWLPCSKLADVLLANHPASGDLSDADFAQWLSERALLARPGTSFWTYLPTQPGQAACQQIAAVTKHSQSPPTIDEGQLEMLVRSAAIHDCRGFLFQSATPLNANDESSRRRTLILELVNRRLELIEPWLTLGKNVGSATSTAAAATATVLQVERTRLLMPATDGTGQHSPAPSKFIVPGVPDSNQAFLLSSTSLKPLASKRVAGGSQITVNRNDDVLVLLTEDPVVISNFRDRVSRAGPKIARLERDLAAAQVKSAAAELRGLRALGVDGTRYQAAVSAANQQIAKCDTMLTAGNFDEALATARAASARLARAAAVERQSLNSAMSLTSVPGDGHYTSFAEQLEFQKALQTLRPGDNQLSGSEFEDLSQLMQLGWQNATTPLPGVVPKAELSADHPHSGRYCLQLAAEAVPPSAAPQIVARPLVRITSPPIHVAKDGLVEISGWIRVPKPIVGNIDGLTIVDSLGGPELALRVRQSPDWQPFRLIRSVSFPADLTISFILNGLGTASIDDVMVCELAAPLAHRLPTTADTPPPAFPRSAGPPLPLSAPLNQR